MSSARTSTILTAPIELCTFRISIIVSHHQYVLSVCFSVCAIACDYFKILWMDRLSEHTMLLIETEIQTLLVYSTDSLRKARSPIHHVFTRFRTVL